MPSLLDKVSQAAKGAVAGFNGKPYSALTAPGEPDKTTATPPAKRGASTGILGDEAPGAATQEPMTTSSVGGSADPSKTVHSSQVTDKDDLDSPDPKRRIVAVPLPFQSVPVNEQQFLLDDTVGSIVEVFTDVLVGGGWKWEGKDAERCKVLTDGIQAALGFDQLIDGLSHSFVQRFTAFEMVWDTSSWWLPSKFRELPNGRNGVTYVDLDELQDIVNLRVTTSGGLQDVPLTNAVISRYRPTFADPLGQTKYTQAKEVVGYKRRADTALVQYIERLAGGVVIGWYQQGMSDADQGKFFAALQKFRSNSVGMLPGPHDADNNDVQLMESKGESGGAGVILEAIEMFSKRTGQLLLGSILAVFEGMYGNRSSSETHMKILQMVVKKYQSELVEQPMNDQVLRPVLEFNVGKGLDLRFLLNPPNFEDVQKLGMMVMDLTQGGYLTPEADKDRVLTAIGFEG